MHLMHSSIHLRKVPVKPTALSTAVILYLLQLSNFNDTITQPYDRKVVTGEISGVPSSF